MTEVTNVKDLKTAKPVGFPALLKSYLPEIKRALPSHMDADRMSRIALTEYRKNPKLSECDPLSVYAAVIIGAQLGLEPGIMGQAYLVPYRGECTFIPGWQGLADLVARAGRASVWTGAVFDGDEFEYMLGDSPKIVHRPQGEDDPEKLIYAYAVGRIKGSDWPIIEVWSKDRILRHRNRVNKVGKSHYSYENLEMYARKVVLLQVLKYLPKSVELATAASLASTQGSQGLSVKDAIEGTWAPVVDDEPKPEEKQKPPVHGTVTPATNNDEKAVELE